MNGAMGSECVGGRKEGETSANGGPPTSSTQIVSMRMLVIATGFSVPLRSATIPPGNNACLTIIICAQH